MLFNGEKFANLTHADLDGISSYIVLSDCFKEQVSTFKVTGYQKIQLNLEKLAFNYSNIVITDLSLSDEDIKYVEDSFKNAVIIDHHKDIETSCEKLINLDYCGAVLTAGFCKRFGYKPSADIRRLLKYTQDYDCWIHKYPESRILNFIYWDMGPFQFEKMYCEGVVEKWKEMPLYNRGLELEKKVKNEILAAENYNVEGIRVIFIENHVSDVSFYFPEDHFIILRSGGKFSLRSKKLELSALYEELSEYCSNIGGHKQAGGGTLLDKDNFIKVVECFVEYIK